MFLSWALGLVMAARAGWFGASWLTGKLVLVVGLSALHGTLAGTLRRLTGEHLRRPGRHWRWAPYWLVVVTGVIAGLVVLKPV